MEPDPSLIDALRREIDVLKADVDRLQSVEKENDELKRKIAELLDKGQKKEKKKEKRQFLQKPPPKGNLKPPKKGTTIYICYDEETGETAAKEIAEELTRQKATNELLKIGKDVDYEKLETTVAGAKSVAFILSKDALFNPGMAFAMECTLLYKAVRDILVHDVETCFFPGEDQQPDSVRSLFQEKAITYLKDYVDSAVAQIIAKSNEKVTATKQETLRKSNTENVATRVFLSHKRLTAQGIAGRIYDALKQDYKVFLDSEASFQLHDLELIVKQTQLFIFILSAGVLESEWCLKELRTAIQCKKQIIMVRDYQFKWPPKFTEDLEDVKDTIMNSPSYIYMAEYCTQCVAKIKSTALGPPDKVLDKVNSWLKDQKSQQQANSFDRKTWNDTMDLLISGLCLCVRYPFESLERLSLSDAQINAKQIQLYDPQLQLFKNLNSLTYLNLSQCRNITDVGVSHILSQCPELKTLNLSEAINISDASLKALCQHNKKIESLDLADCSITDVGLQHFASGLPKLEYLKIAHKEGYRKITDKAMVAIGAGCPNLEEIHMSRCKEVKDEGLRVLAKGCTKLKCLRISDLSGLTDEGLKAVADNCTSLQMLAACNVKFSYAGMSYAVQKCKDLCYSNSWKHIISSKEKPELLKLMGTREKKYQDDHD